MSKFIRRIYNPLIYHPLSVTTNFPICKLLIEVSYSCIICGVLFFINFLDKRGIEDSMTKVKPTHLEIFLLPDTQLVVLKMDDEENQDFIQILMRRLSLENLPAILSMELYHQTALLKYFDIDLSCVEPCDVHDNSDVCKLCLVNYIYDELAFML